MTRLTLLFLFFLSGLLSAEEASKIIGTWKSDKELTFQHIEKHAKITPAQHRVLSGLFGRCTFTFRADGIGEMNSAAYTLETEDGKEIKVEAQTTKFTYKILGESPLQVVTEIKYEEDSGVSLFLGDVPFGISYFPDKDTFWCYVGNEVFDLHVREYFKRVKTDQ
ncbi:hypothetical protein SAMN02745181_0225 [Rubritalea squalenifaciens DSM 18772]|uniref:DUF4488 domain-containing protein n=1 Tax=Rubritalea squalenifaciens DSM 18772 TaxID=1123071 RepID=A0A1M6BHV0_9BACT|nr:hypothetical protein [Rubritalea squalenifaciens]SHI48312.1 hypothetical protein SAMN02745181_0225 [Rubritalea squalenifaciens DSM 18772]